MAFLRPPAAAYSETASYLEEAERSEGGYFAALNRAQDTLFRCSGTIRLPDSSGNVAGTLLDFLEARTGIVDTFLYLPVLQRNRKVTGGALGTGDGADATFLFSAGTNLHRHIVNGDHSDPVTLKVYVAGVLQTLTTHYTVSGNDTDPLITFDAGAIPAGAAAITVSYEFYVPVRFASSDLDPRVLSRRKSDEIDAEELTEFSVALVEDRPGKRYA